MIRVDSVRCWRYTLYRMPSSEVFSFATGFCFNLLNKGFHLATSACVASVTVASSSGTCGACNCFSAQWLIVWTSSSSWLRPLSPSRRRLIINENDCQISGSQPPVTSQSLMPKCIIKPHSLQCERSHRLWLLCTRRRVPLTGMKVKPLFSKLDLERLYAVVVSVSHKSIRNTEIKM